jgi:hypothetical protein
MLNAKGIFSFSPFALMFVPLLIISLHIHMNPNYTTHVQWYDMFKWPYINEFQPKGNNDMMQFVACNKSSLFGPRLKNCVNKEKNKYFCRTRQNFKFSWSERH